MKKVRQFQLNSFVLAMVVASATVLTGCGGGSGGGGSNVKPSSPSNEVHEEGYSGVDPITSPVVTVDPNLAFPLWVMNNADLMKISHFRDAGFDGTGVKVAVLDSGVAPNNAEWPDTVWDYDKTLVTNQMYNPDGTHTGDTTTFTGSHGPHMAAIIGSSATGIAPGVTMIHGDISLGVYTTSTNLIMGIDWAISQGADFINISFEQSSYTYLKPHVTQEMLDANGMGEYGYLIGKIEAIQNSGSVIVHSAGNSSSHSMTSNETADIWDIAIAAPSHILYVGGIESTGVQSVYSDKPGDNIHIQNRYILAPGTSELPDGSFSHGTSGAAANVTGALSLIKSRWNSMSSMDAAQLVLDTSNKDIENYNVEHHGQGVLDMYRAMQPVGQTSVTTISGASLPLNSMAVTLPAGFSQVTYEQSFFDGYGRDFVATFKSQSKPYRSDLVRSMSRIGFDYKPNYMAMSGSLAIGFSELPSGAFYALDVQSNFVEMKNLANGLFSTERAMQQVAFKSGDYGFSFSMNARDNFDGTMSQSFLDKGFATQFSYADTLKLDYFQSMQTHIVEPLFFGANERYFQGARLSVAHSGFFGGAEYGVEQYSGLNGLNGVFNQANIQTQAFFVGAGKQFNGFSTGIMARTEQQSLGLKGTLTGSVGNGDTFHHNVTLSSKNQLDSAGAYISTKHVHLAAYKNTFDQGVSLKFNKAF